MIGFYVGRGFSLARELIGLVGLIGLARLPTYPNPINLTNPTNPIHPFYGFTLTHPHISSSKCGSTAQITR